MSKITHALSATAAVAAAVQGFFLWQTLGETRQGSMRQLIVDSCAAFISSANEAQRDYSTIFSFHPDSPLPKLSYTEVSEEVRSGVLARAFASAPEQYEAARKSRDRLILFSGEETESALRSSTSALIMLANHSTQIEAATRAGIEGATDQIERNMQIVERNCVEVAQGKQTLLR